MAKAKKSGKGKNARRNTTPLQVTLDKVKGRRATNTGYRESILPVTSPFCMEFWFRGTPRPKNQGYPQINWKVRKAYIAPDAANTAHENKIRGMFLEQIESKYAQHIPYLPIVEGVARVRIVALMPPTDSYYPGKEYLHGADDENLAKVVKDALAGRKLGKAPLLYWDDCLSKSTEVTKDYWRPEYSMVPNYPQEPGVLFVARIDPKVRNPELLSLEEGFCPTCYESKWGTKRGFQKHVETCTK